MAHKSALKGIQTLCGKDAEYSTESPKRLAVAAVDAVTRTLPGECIAPTALMVKVLRLMPHFVQRRLVREAVRNFAYVGRTTLGLRVANRVLLLVMFAGAILLALA